ncbi:hypothetical protein ACFLSJ_00535 [Verrucomicrobiota bacterium]
MEGDEGIAEAPPPARPKRWKRIAQLIAKTALSLILFCALAEAVALALFPPLTGSSFSYAHVRGERVSRIEKLRRKHQQTRILRSGQPEVAFHPFLGYAPAEQGDHGGGLWLSDGPATGEAPFTIAVLGGSVAYRFCQSQALPEALRSSHAFQQRDVVLVPLAFEGYRHPQQLNALVLALLSDIHLDFVVSLDGLNEATMGIANLRRGAGLLMPEQGMMARLSEMQQHDLSWPTLRLLHALRRLSERELGILDIVERSVLRYSVAANLVCQVLAASARKHGKAMEASWARDITESTTFEPDSPAVTIENTVAGDIAGYWAKSTRMVHAICAEYGIPYIAFIQPSLFVPDAKPLTAGERDLVPRRDPLEIAALRRIREAAVSCRDTGVSVCDLTDVFQSTQETVYTDFCHLNELGEAILAQRIAGEVSALLQEELQPSTRRSAQ